MDADDPEDHEIRWSNNNTFNVRSLSGPNDVLRAFTVQKFAGFQPQYVLES